MVRTRVVPLRRIAIAAAAVLAVAWSAGCSGSSADVVPTGSVNADDAGQGSTTTAPTVEPAAAAVDDVVGRLRQLEMFGATTTDERRCAAREMLAAVGVDRTVALLRSVSESRSTAVDPLAARFGAIAVGCFDARAGVASASLRYGGDFDSTACIGRAISEADLPAVVGLAFAPTPAMLVAPAYATWMKAIGGCVAAPELLDKMAFGISGILPELGPTARACLASALVARVGAPDAHRIVAASRQLTEADRAVLEELVATCLSR
jgi:hypothetical protein